MKKLSCLFPHYLKWRIVVVHGSSWYFLTVDQNKDILEQWGRKENSEVFNQQRGAIYCNFLTTSPIARMFSAGNLQQV